MDLNTFLEHFDTIAEAPGGIAKLKALILDLAVRGKLVPQDPEDETAHLLLKRVWGECQNLIEQKQLKKESELPPISEEEIFHAVPENWVWTRLGKVIHYTAAEKVTSEEIPDNAWLLDLEDIEKDTSRIIRRKTFNEQPSKSTKAYFKKNDVLYGKLRPYLNKVVVADDDGYCTTEIVPLKPYSGLVPKYVMYALKRSDFLNYVNSKTYGINLPRLSTDDARKALFPLPPLAEQKRIVEKVDELMALCDRLAAAKQTRDNLRQKLRGSAIAALMNAETDEALEKSWAIVRDNWHTLSQDPKDVDELRRSVLQLAVRGKLVRHTNSFKKPLKKFLSFQNGYAFKSEWYEPKGMRLVRNQNIGHGNLRWEEVKYIDPQKAEEFKRFALREGDTVISLDRPIINTGLKIARIKAEDVPSLLLQRVARPFFKDDSLSPDYFFMWLNSPEFTRAIDPGRSNGVPHISTGALENIEILVPPLTEQKRIVAKVDELMQMCDQLEASLRQSQQRASALAASAISHLTI